MSVSIEAGIRVSGRRPHQHHRGDGQDGGGQADHRGGVAATALTAGANYSPAPAEIAGLHGGVLPKRHVATSRIVRLTLLAFEDRSSKTIFSPNQPNTRFHPSPHARQFPH